MKTAEEFIKGLQYEYEDTGEYKMYFAIDIPDKMREFAQMHVTEAFNTISPCKYMTGIIEAVRRNGTCGGYYWKYE